MSQNQSMSESAKSMPILVSSDCSLSYKSFNSAPIVNLENDTENHTESRATVKALINKFGSLQGKSIQNNVSNFDIKKKPKIATDGEKLETPCNECNMYMEGDDVMRMDDTKDIVRCHYSHLVTI